MKEKHKLYGIILNRYACVLHPRFSIRGKDTDVEDFVQVEYDHKDYCCVNIKVEPINRVTKVLGTMKKYELTAEQMEEIQDALVNTIGRRSQCGLCS